MSVARIRTALPAASPGSALLIVMRTRAGRLSAARSPSEVTRSVSGCPRTGRGSISSTKPRTSAALICFSSTGARTHSTRSLASPKPSEADSSAAMSKPATVERVPRARNATIAISGSNAVSSAGSLGSAK
jgi:hypothetical protein